jgi:hypothetical protein
MRLRVQLTGYNPSLVDFQRFRKLPASQTCVATVATSFFTLLASDSPAATQVRAGFLPALLASDARRPNQSDPVLDATLRHLFASPPNVVIVQGIVTAQQISAAWSREQKQTGQTTTTAVPSGAPMRDSVLVPWALMQELEQASASHGGSDDAVAGAQEAEEVANLKIMVLSVLVYELAHWVFVRAHGYQAPSWSTVQDSMSLLTASGSVSSLHSTQSLLILPGSTTDVGFKALSACFGCTFECLAYAIGEFGRIPSCLSVEHALSPRRRGASEISHTSLRVVMAR